MEQSKPQIEPPAAAVAPLSYRAYAKRRGVSLTAVQRAIREGRLERSIGLHRGKRAVVDPELADREWAERTRPRPGAVAPVEIPPPTVGEDDVPANTSLWEAERVRAVELARRERIRREVDSLDLAKRKGELISVAEARATVIDRFTVVKTKLLGVPARVKQRLPHVAAEDVRVVDDLIREALEDLAGGDG